MRSMLYSVVLVVFGASGAIADREADLDHLADLLHVDKMIEILAEEGQEYGQSIAEEMFGERNNPQWDRRLSDIYQTSEMIEGFRREFDPLIDEETLSALIAFFDTPFGEKLVRLEMTAREAISDPDVKDASSEVLEQMIEQDDPLLPQLRDYIDANDLIDLNVASSMNESFAFLSAMGQAGALMGDSSESSILSDVWGDEPQIRTDTEEWLMSYLALCYAPLSTEEMEKNIAFGRSDEGRVFNQALFAAFNEIYMVISSELGRSAAGVIMSEEL